MDDLVVVGVYNTRIEAEMVNNLLMSNKIKSFIEHVDIGLPVTHDPGGPTRIMAREKDIEKIKNVLEAFNESSK